MNTRYFLYIGLDLDKKKNERFVIRVDDYNPEKSLMKGVVVARNDRAYHYLAYENDTFVNPATDPFACFLSIGKLMINDKMTHIDRNLID